MITLDTAATFAIFGMGIALIGTTTGLLWSVKTNGNKIKPHIDSAVNPIKEKINNIESLLKDPDTGLGATVRCFNQFQVNCARTTENQNGRINKIEGSVAQGEMNQTKIDKRIENIETDIKDCPVKKQ